MLHVAHKSFEQIERSFAYSLIVEEFNMGTKNLAKWFVWVCKTDKFGRNGRQSSLCCLCALEIPYIVAHLVSGLVSGQGFPISASTRTLNKKK